MTLYEIKQNYLDALTALTVDEDTGEVLGAEALDAIAGEFDEKAVAVGCFIKEITAEAEAIKAEEKALKDRREAREKKIEKLKRYLTDTMLTLGKTSVDDPKVRISFRASEHVEELNEDEIPACFFTLKTERKLDKKKVTERLRAGEVVPGAALVSEQKIQIK